MYGVYVYMYVCIPVMVGTLWVCLHTCMCVCMCVYLYTCYCMARYGCVYIHVCMYVCIPVIVWHKHPLPQNNAILCHHTEWGWIMIGGERGGGGNMIQNHRWGGSI